MTKIVNKKYIQINCKKISKNIMLPILIYSIMTSSTINVSYANSEEEQKSLIRVYPKSYDPNKKEIRNLVASPVMKVEYLEVDLSNKKLTIFQTGKEPQEIEKIWQPSTFPWQLASEEMGSFLSSQSFLLKMMDDGSYKVDMHTIGKGGGLWSELFKAVAMDIVWESLKPRDVYAPGLSEKEKRQLGYPTKKSPAKRK